MFVPAHITNSFSMKLNTTLTLYTIGGSEVDFPVPPSSRHRTMSHIINMGISSLKYIYVWDFASHHIEARIHNDIINIRAISHETIFQFMRNSLWEGLLGSTII